MHFFFAGIAPGLTIVHAGIKPVFMNALLPSLFVRRLIQGRVQIADTCRSALHQILRYRKSFAPIVPSELIPELLVTGHPASFI